MKNFVFSLPFCGGMRVVYAIYFFLASLILIIDSSDVTLLRAFAVSSFLKFKFLFKMFDFFFLLSNLRDEVTFCFFNTFDFCILFFNHCIC